MSIKTHAEKKSVTVLKLGHFPFWKCNVSESQVSKGSTDKSAFFTTPAKVGISPRFPKNIFDLSYVTVNQFMPILTAQTFGRAYPASPGLAMANQWQESAIPGC